MTGRKTPSRGEARNNPSSHDQMPIPLSKQDGSLFRPFPREEAGQGKREAGKAQRAKIHEPGARNGPFRPKVRLKPLQLRGAFPSLAGPNGLQWVASC